MAEILRQNTTEDVDPALLDTYKLQRRSAPVADRRDVQELVDALLGAKSPVIVAGQGILYAEACDELKTLAELTQTPVMSTLNGKSCFPENHPLSLGCAGGARPDPGVAENRAALDAAKLMPRNLSAAADQPDCSQTLFGMTFDMPFGVAPVGLSGHFGRQRRLG